MEKNKQIQWFRVYNVNTEAIKNIPDEKVGAAFKAVCGYAATGQEEPINDLIIKIVYDLLKKGVDDSVNQYNAQVEGGKKGSKARTEKEKRMQEMANAAYEENGGDEQEPQIPTFEKRR